MTIGEKLTALRHRKGLSQEEICQALNRRFPDLPLTRSYYAYLENDKKGMTVEHVKAFATFFRITADELIFENRPVEILKGKSGKSLRLKVTLRHP